MTHVADMRRSYERGELSESDVGTDPIVVFRTWFQQAREGGEIEANAMNLSTVDASGAPHARIVLLKEMRDDGAFVFFTNYESAKGRQIAETGLAALTFVWLRSERQVRVEGRVERVPEAVSDAYFAQRPRESQLGAWASAQSQPVASREALEARYAAVEARFDGATIPRPDFWGGYVVVPTLIEFWQGRVGRMHDRLCFEREAASEAWSIVRRMP